MYIDYISILGIKKNFLKLFSSVQFSHSVIFDSLWSHELQHIRPPWNAKVGSQETPGVTEKFGLGVQNEAGQRLIEFFQVNTLVIANTLFQQHKRRLYTWTSPDGQHRNQIDYILFFFEVFFLIFQSVLLKHNLHIIKFTHLSV